VRRPFSISVTPTLDIIATMPLSKDLRPLTNDQAVQLRHDLMFVEERLQDIAIFMRICYGDESQAVIRADETAAALQRLKWELERTKVQKPGD
jgi:Trm5-related predicted tRNA methylase